jgi:hypothetical protein
MSILKFPGALALRLLMFSVPVLWGSVAASAQQPATQPAVTNPDQALDRAIANEAELIKRLKTMQPVVETYIQQMKSDEDLGAIPKTDNYFLGKLDLAKEVSDDSFIPAPGFVKRSLGVFPHSHLIFCRAVLRKWL